MPTFSSPRFFVAPRRPALELQHDGFVGADGYADYFFIQAQRHADIAHLILERFDNFAIDEFEQPRPPFHQHDRNAERC